MRKAKARAKRLERRQKDSKASMDQDNTRSMHVQNRKENGGFHKLGSLQK